MDVSTAIKTALEDALRTGPERVMTRSSAVKNALDEHRDLIVKAMAKGYSPTGLAKKLKASGISASVESLRQSLQVIAATANGAKSKSHKTRPQKKTTASRPVTSHLPRGTESKAFEAEDRTA